MGKGNIEFLAFNRGLVDPLSLARTDVERTRLSAETMMNFFPKTQGAMRMRPGSKYLGTSDSNNPAQFIPFVAAVDDIALVELTDALLRVWISDAVVQRPSVSTSISNGSFATSTNWTDASVAGGAPTYGGSGLILNATNTGGIAEVTRQITVAGGDQNVEHGLAIHVSRGPIVFKVGSSSGADDYVAETELRTGYHSLAFTPTGDFYLSIKSESLVNRIIASIAVEASGDMTVTTPWAEASLDNIRSQQSADVLFIACEDQKQYRIERRGSGRSWSVVEYTPTDGPFFTLPSSKALLTPGATYGNTTLASSQPFFKSTHVGALFRIFQDGQHGVYKFATDDVYSDVWKVTGIGSTTERRSTIVTTGTFSANIRVQRSFDGPDSGFKTVSTITTATTTNVDDADDNVTVYYRLAIPSGDYTSGTVTATLTYSGGGKDGVCRVLAFNSSTSVDIEILSRFSSATQGASDWAEILWSDAQAWPTEVALHEGRLWWFGGSRAIGSVSDDYENFNAGTVGDSAPISRILGKGPVNKINFAISLLRLFIGTAGEEISMRSNSLEEPLTNTNSSAKTISTKGSSNLAALLLDDRGVFINRAGNRAYMIAYSSDANDYTTEDLTLLVPNLLNNVVSAAVQILPDTRLHFVLADGTVAILTYQAAEQVNCWHLYKTTAADGAVERVVVLPGTTEDQVYYLVNRTIDGSTVRYLERQAMESESVGGALNWLMDCAIQITQASSATITGLDHLEGEKVLLWSAGSDKSTDDADGIQTLYTVTGGEITAPAALTSAIVGLPYIKRTDDNEMDAEFKSTKLAYVAVAGTALGMKKRVNEMGLILGTTHNNGLFHGRSLDVDDLRPLPRVINGREITDVDELLGEDVLPFPFSGQYDTDSRYCLAAKAPRPCTLMAAILNIDTIG